MCGGATQGRTVASCALAMLGMLAYLAPEPAAGQATHAGNGHGHPGAGMHGPHGIPGCPPWGRRFLLLPPIWTPPYLPGPVTVPPPTFYYASTYVAAPPAGPPIVMDLPTPQAVPFDPTNPVAGADSLAGQPAAQARAIHQARYRVNIAPATARRQVEQAQERLTVGDRYFRAGEYRRASVRYQEAIDADPDDPQPYVRLAQVAVARGEYGEAANRFREAQMVRPGWMLAARDVQNLFGDPTDFARVLSTLESYLQTHPEDRDGWLVLGAELYLSRRTDRAADCFVRLTDRAPDSTLSAFLDAAKTNP